MWFEEFAVDPLTIDPNNREVVLTETSWDGVKRNRYHCLKCGQAHVLAVVTEEPKPFCGSCTPLRNGLVRSYAIADFEDVTLTGSAQPEVVGKCDICGAEMNKRSGARTCSPKCRKALSRRR